MDEKLPLDLQPVASERRWRELAETPDDNRLTALLLRAHDDAEAFTDRVVARILETVRPGTAVDEVRGGDLWWTVHRNFELHLLLLAERRDATESELRARAQLGVRRAEAGLPLNDVLRAFRVGYLVFWEELAALARDTGRQAVDELLDNAGRGWALFDRISAAVETAYRDRTALRDLDSRRRARRFLAGLLALPDDREATAEQARALDLDPSGPWVAAIVAGHIVKSPRPRQMIAVEQPDRSVVVAQPRHTGPDAEKRLARALMTRGQIGLGVGIVRPGLDGAKASLRDAERAHRAAIELNARYLSFRDHWFECLALESAASLRPLVVEAVNALRAAPELARTVDAYLAADGTLTEAASALHVHANTVSYRLQRLFDTTGLDPRTSKGALTARLALTLANAAEKHQT